MKAVTIKELKLELDNLSPKELRELCLHLSKFKKENKELLTYLLFEASDEASYVLSVKREVDLQFEQINKKSYYLIKKGLRRILLNIRKYIRYSRKKETEIDLLIYFCVKLKKFTPFVQKNSRLRNLYDGQIETIRKKVLSLHEDLQFDYETELNIMNN
jgi:hypothetical protein